MSRTDPKLLFVSYFFPPAGGISCQRAIRFARYLKRNRWEPVVLTYEGEYPWRIVDRTLARRVADIRTIRVPAPPLERYFSGKISPAEKFAVLMEGTLNTDVMSLWVRRLIPKLPKILSEIRPDLVMITVPPFSALRLIPEIKKTADIPTIVDIRDLGWILNPHGGPLRRAANSLQLKKAQRKLFPLVACADGVVAPTDAIISEIERRFSIPTGTIPTPFDPQDFADMPQYSPGEKFRILHSGRIYRSNRAEDLVRVFSALPDDILERTELVLQGHDNPQSERKYGKIPWIRFEATVPHGEAVKSQSAADVNLVFVSESPRRGGHLIVPGKVFDYIGAGRPILALAPSGSALNTLVERNRLGFAAPIDFTELAAGTIARIFRLWERGELSPIPSEQREKFSAEQVVPQLAEFLGKFLD